MPDPPALPPSVSVGPVWGSPWHWETPGPRRPPHSCTAPPHTPAPSCPSLAPPGSHCWLSGHAGAATVLAEGPGTLRGMGKGRLAILAIRSRKQAWPTLAGFQGGTENAEVPRRSLNIICELPHPTRRSGREKRDGPLPAPFTRLLKAGHFGLRSTWGLSLCSLVLARKSQLTGLSHILHHAQASEGPLPC